jgi:type IV pilus assembly protein PilW
MKHSDRSCMRPQRGVSLVELMVALVLGLFLIFGAVTVYQQSRTAFRANEAVARMQEAARLAFDVLEADIRMANYWGLSNQSEYIINRAGPSASLPAYFTGGQGTNIDACNVGTAHNWAINLDAYLDGTNNGYGLNTTNCPGIGGASTTADTLVVRRGGEAQPTTLDVNRIYVQSSRIQGTLFVASSTCTDPTLASCIPAGYTPPASQTRELIVHAYYVSNQSTLRTDVPALRRKRFVNVNAASATGAIIDEEIVPGIEDFQVRLGVDTNGAEPDGSLNADSYVNPGAVPAGAQVVSATVWLRVRAEDREFSHVDGNAYAYADVNIAAPGDNYRRIVVSKTIQLRNSRS